MSEEQRRPAWADTPRTVKKSEPSTAWLGPGTVLLLCAFALLAASMFVKALG